MTKSIYLQFLSYLALVATGCLFSVHAMAAGNGAEIEAPSAYAETGQITYCANFTNPPREFRINGKPAGADVDLALAMADKLGLEVDWLQVKFAGLITALQGGNCDMIVGELFIKPERKEVIQFVPFSTSGQQIVVRKGEAQGISSLEGLAGMKVAVPNGTTFQQRIQKYNKEARQQNEPVIDTLVVPSTREMFHTVLVGMADAAGATTTSAGYYLGKTHGRLELAGDSFGRIRDGFGIRKSEDALDAAMTKALNALRADGTYAKIFKKYNLEGAMLQ